MEKKEILNLQIEALLNRMNVLKMLHNIGSGHIGGAYSCAEILTYLYFSRMHVNRQEPEAANRDRLILSKGHASAMLYSVLSRKGFFPEEELLTFRAIDSRLQGHPALGKTPGVDMSTGALGHGLSIGLGMSLASKTAPTQFWIYVIVGEGCLNEGQTWEAAMAAAKYKPEKLVLLIDYNGVQLDGTSDDIMPLGSLRDKFEAFGWHVSDELYDGHNFDSIESSFTWLDSLKKGPSVLIYKTTKGKGVDFMENTNKWHGAPVTDNDYQKALPQLEAKLKKLEGEI